MNPNEVNVAFIHSIQLEAEFIEIEIRAIFNLELFRGESKTSISRARKHIVNLFHILLQILYSACVVAVLAACSE